MVGKISNDRVGINIKISIIVALNPEEYGNRLKWYLLTFRDSYKSWYTRGSQHFSTDHDGFILFFAHPH
jgi:hypothetical protein